MTTQQHIPIVRIPCKELADSQNNNKIALDYSFQSEERWSDKQRQDYIKSIFRQFIPNPITLADINSCAEYCAHKFGVDSEDYKYFDEWRNAGYEYISIDGNNRTRCISKFFTNQFPLSQTEHKIVGIKHDVYKNWTPTKNTKKYSNLPLYVKEFVDNKDFCVTCFIVKEATIQDLHDLFISINSQVTLNAQESRNAIVCDVSKKIREYSETFKEFFSRYFTENSMKRRNHEEFSVSLLVHITKLLSGNINKAELDLAYNNSSPETKNLKKLYEVLKIADECTKFEKKNVSKKKKFIPNEATLFDFCMIVSHLNDKNVPIRNHKKFFEWFYSQYQIIKTRKDENNNPLILWKDSNGQNARDYVGVQRSKDAAHREARLKCYIESLSKIDDGIIGEERDPKRFFCPSVRPLLWLQQDKKCALSGEEIFLEQVFDGSVTEIDHIVPYSQGGLTVIENAQLVFKFENRQKSDSIPVGTL